MKSLKILTAVFLSLALIAGCSDSSSDTSSLNVPAAVASPDNQVNLAATLATTPLADLSDTEIAGLVYMREEEKLARDVYLTFADTYGVAIFSNIAAAEQRHADAVLMMLDRYEVDDPVDDNPVGVFQNEDLQALYDELVASGNESLAAAYYVGCAVEEIDITDLVADMADTDADDILLVYGRLLAGSGNHLRAFVPAWELETGETYVPRYLSSEDFEAIISADHTSGQRGGGWRGGRN